MVGSGVGAGMRLIAGSSEMTTEASTVSVGRNSMVMS
jgi:hypothetical protein